MKEKIIKITYILMMFFMASSFEMFAANPDGPDEPVVTKDNPENPPTSTTIPVNMPSPKPEQAIADHSEADQLVLQPILSLDNDNYAMVSLAPMGEAAPISMMSKSMPASFRGVASNEIIGWENLNTIFNDIAKGEKTVKILQIGDSHVRGNIYPQTIQRSLESKLNVL